MSKDKLSSNGKSNGKAAAAPRSAGFFGLAKYREIIISIALFLIFDLGVLVLNFFISSQIATDAIGVNLSGRQRMLSQRMAKTLFQIKEAHDNGRNITVPQTELNTAYSLFETTLGGFQYGETVAGGDGNLVFLNAAASDTAQAILERTMLVWQPYRQWLTGVRSISDPLARSYSDSVAIAEAVVYTEANNLKLLALMNALTFELESVATKKANTLRIIQTVGILLALTNFFILLFHFIRKLRAADAELAQYSEGLEQKVAARTAELNELNQTLERKVDERTAELRNSQSQLIQSEKMASLGQMVAGLAHEVNTPLGFVRGSIDVIRKNQTSLKTAIEKHQTIVGQLMAGNYEQLEALLKEVVEVDEKINRTSAVRKIQDRLDESVIGLDRIQELIINLKNFSRLDEMAFKLADLNEGIDSTLMIATNVLKHKAEVKRDYRLTTPIECYPSQLNQVFLNLLTNAAQAMETSGIISVKTFEDNGSAVVEIADNGKGISPENLRKIFEPFFTTKGIGQGTGLGLSIVYKIIQNHNGTIDVQSTVGVGTVFTIRIPIHQKKKTVQTLSSTPAFIDE
jgi:two-component system, NtrC family, sensor kinase